MRVLLTSCLSMLAVASYASEVPLCALPVVGSKVVVNNAQVEGDKDPGCADVLANATKAAKSANSKINLNNTSTIPSQLSVGTVYLQPINMAPTGMMLPRDKSDIHLEIDIHAKANLKSRGFAPGDWLPNAKVTYTIQKIGSNAPIQCGKDKSGKPKTTCDLMAMVASDGAHYGDNVKLDGPGFYVATFDAKTDPMTFGWHTDTDSKVLGTEYVDWKFKQSYLFKFTGIGKKGGY
ncbi:MAG: iron transporter [Burkholderiales bacterium]|nr:iron transporter [Burkholderiales bacterium]